MSGTIDGLSDRVRVGVEDGDLGESSTGGAGDSSIGTGKYSNIAGGNAGGAVGVAGAGGNVGVGWWGGEEVLLSWTSWLCGG